VLAIFGDEGEALLLGVQRRLYFDRRTIDLNGSRRHFGSTDEGVGDVGSSGTHESGESDDFSGFDVKTDIVNSAGDRKVLDGKSRGLVFVVAGDGGGFDVPSDHVADDFGGGGILGGEFGDFASVAKDGDAVADLEDFF